MNAQKLYLFKTLQVSDIKDPIRIDLYLSRHFPETGRTQFQKQIANKWIKVNHSFVNKGSKVFPNDQIEIYTPYKSKIEWVANPEIKFDVIFEDEHLIVVNKEAGIQIHPASGNYDNTLINGLVAYLSTKNEKIFLVHRLDKFTSGLIVFAKTEAARDFLSNAFSNKLAKRSYTAIIWGKIDEFGTIDETIGRLPKNNKKFGYLSIDEGGKSAITHYKRIQAFPFHSVVKCKLETGRTHQIRVHMQSIENPIVGDWEYGGNLPIIGLRTTEYMQKMDKLLSLFKGQALQATVLEFPHPESKEIMHFELDLPESFTKAIAILEEY